MKIDEIAEVIERLRQREIEIDAVGITPLGSSLECDARILIERLAKEIDALTVKVSG